MKRRLFVASSLAAAGLAGCGSVGNAINESPLHKMLALADTLDHTVIGTRGLAKTYRESDIDRDFRVNGLNTPSDARYQSYVADGFRSYRLIVDGLVDAPRAFDLAALRALPLQTQITRHDCVEGWSAIGKWRGPRLADVLAVARPKPAARFAVMYCFDRDEQGTPFYGSLDLAQAAHPQTLLALDLNDLPLDPDHGAPVRLRIPTQLGYKSSKWVGRIALVPTLAGIFGGNGGYWEDQGYDWYAGI